MNFQKNFEQNPQKNLQAKSEGRNYDRYIFIEREREKNRKFGVNGFEFYEVYQDIRTTKNIIQSILGFL